MVTRNGLITLMATGTTTLATYVFQTSMARLLSTLEYGELSSIVASLNILTIPMFGLTMAITRDVAAIRAVGHEHFAVLIRPYVVRLAGVTAAMLIALLLVNPWLATFLQLSSLAPLVFLAILVALTNVVGIGRAVLLGLHDFASVALNQVAEGLLRLVSGVAIATSGVVGAAGFAGYVVGLFAAFVMVASRIPSQARVLLLAPWPWRGKPDQILDTRGSHRDISWPAIIVTGTYVALLNMDVLVVKHFLSPDQAGQYAVMSMLGRGLFVITNAFDVVLFPAASAARAGGADALAHLRRAVLSVGAIVIPILVVYWLMAGPLLNLLFGPRYVELAPLLAPYGVATTLLGLSTLLSRYRLAVGSAVRSPALLAVVAAAAAGFLVFHDTVAEIVGVLLLTTTVSLIVALFGAAGHGKTWI